MTKKKFRVQWYDQNEIIYTEPRPVEAFNEADAECEAYKLYNGKNTPGPLLSVEEI